MEIEEALAFVRANHHGVMATTRADGGTQMSPVTPGVDGGQVVVSSRETAYKVAHVRARPHAAICVFTDAFYGSWVQLEGPVEVVSLPEAMEQLVEYYRAISGEHPDWEDYRRAMVDDRRVMIRLTPERVGPNVQG